MKSPGMRWVIELSRAMRNMGWASPHNCTVCEKFEGNLIFRSDSEPEIERSEDIIWIDCNKMGKHVVNNSLVVCNDFFYNEKSESLVIRDPEFRSLHHIRVWMRAFVGPDISPMQRMIYNCVCNVQDDDKRGWMLQVCINRIHRDTGVSQEAVFRCVMGMIEAGYLLRDTIEGAVYLRSPPLVTNIGDIGKKKVMI